MIELAYMGRAFDFSIDEWYHLFSRGIDKRITFEDKTDYERFLSLLFLANSDLPITLFNKASTTLPDALQFLRGSPLVDMGAYCLMPNHYHLLVKEIVEGGISRFMQKIGTGYTMYFNTRYQRTGSLFMRPFRARHIHDDNYLQKVVAYVHMNPAELIESGWKQGKVRDMKKLREDLAAYPNSSLKDFVDLSSPTRRIVGSEIFDIYHPTLIEKMLRDAREIYEDVVPD